MCNILSYSSLPSLLVLILQNTVISTRNGSIMNCWLRHLCSKWGRNDTGRRAVGSVLIWSYIKSPRTEVQVSINLKSSHREGASHLDCKDLDGPHGDSWCMVASIGLPSMCPWTTETVMYLGPHVSCTARLCAESVSRTVIRFSFILPHVGCQDVTVCMLLFSLCLALAWLVSNQLSLT